MKIHQLPEGARFEYEGEEYVKTGPMSAAGPRGSRLIPKYAVLRSLESATPAPKPPPAPLSRDSVREAFEAFHAECAARLPAGEQDALAAARERFLRCLD